jgi:hypothetical protein
MQSVWKGLTYANVTATVALFIAVGGATAFAARQLAPRSVGERQLRPGAVTAKKLRKSSVTAPKIKPLSVKEGKLAGGAVVASKLGFGSVTNEKLASGAVSSDKIAPGAVTGDKVDESTLSTVPAATQSAFAVEAGSANPVAFAAVSQEGNVDLSLSKGIGPGNVVQGTEPGVYCVSTPGFNSRGAQVTPRYNGAGAVSVFVTIGGTGSCPAPAVEVQTFSGGSRIKEPFYISLYR